TGGVPLVEAHLCPGGGRPARRDAGGRRRHVRGHSGRRQGKDGAELCAGAPDRREGEGEGNREGRVRSGRLSVSRAREGRRRWRAQGRIGALMDHEEQPRPSGPAAVETAETAHAGGGGGVGEAGSRPEERSAGGGAGAVGG